MRTRSLPLALLVAIAACGGAAEKPAAAPAVAKDAFAPDTTPKADLSKLNSNIPAAALDTFTPVKPRKLIVEKIPDAPAPLMDAAEREEGISRFCYQEYGQKVDPKLIGAVALVVTVDDNTVQKVRVGADDWSSGAGRAVNACLVQKAPQAWKIVPGSKVAAGQYVVQLRFRPS
ncbi:MAG: hypothetical protein HY084_10620 [Gemmatimonadetes bacterium]|nr:hypothetical protein [Gemmatimonadota bacterium]